MTKEKEIGKIIHYFGNLEVGIIELSAKLKVGDKIHIKGATTDFEQVVSSMQIDRQDVESAKKGNSIGVKLDDKIREGDVVYLAAKA